MTMSIILGLDPGTAATGYGIIKVDRPRLFFIDCGVIKTKPGKEPGVRLEKIYKKTAQIIKKHKIQEAACEDVFFAKNKKTAKKVFQAKGVLILACQQRKIPFFEYSPLEIKKALTGYGRAEKIQTQKMVKVELGLDKVPNPTHVADALACAICHARVRGR